MTQATYRTGPDGTEELGLQEALDRFVDHVMATTDLMWAGADHSGLNDDTISTVAYNLSNEAWYLRKRLDRQQEERMAQIKKDRPELFEEGEE